MRASLLGTWFPHSTIRFLRLLEKATLQTPWPRLLALNRYLTQKDNTLTFNRIDKSNKRLFLTLVILSIDITTD